MAPWRWALALLLLAPGIARADLVSGSWMTGLNAGFGLPQGGGGQVLGLARVLGGQVLYVPYGEVGYGLQVDRFEHAAKSGSAADAYSVLAVARMHLDIESTDNLPYLMGGLGFCGTQAGLPNGSTDRGSGPGLVLGGGYERLLGNSWSLALELRLHRLWSPLATLGRSGLTVGGMALRMSFRTGPSPTPFP